MNGSPEKVPKVHGFGRLTVSFCPISVADVPETVRAEVDNTQDDIDLTAPLNANHPLVGRDVSFDTELVKLVAEDG